MELREREKDRERERESWCLVLGGRVGGRMEEEGEGECNFFNFYFSINFFN